MNRMFACALCLASTWSAAAATADSEDPVVVNEGSARSAAAVPDIARSRPMVNRLPAPDTSTVTAMPNLSPHAPAVMTRSGFRGGSPRAFGTFGIPYTTTRVSDGSYSATGYSAASRLSVTYPYRTAGKLTFLMGSSSAHCSATLIRRSVIVTAAHCIQDFGTGASAYFTGFKFYPGHYGATGATAAQISPYGTWDWAALTRPGSWIDGTDIGSGSARDNDIAVIALKPKNGVFVGDLTGYLGYGMNNYSFVTSSKTGNVHTAAVTTTGYPGLMDAGRIMQRSDGPAYVTTVGGAGQLWQGSNFTGGSSGGAWIVNFRTRAASLSGGATLGSESEMSVVGVTSWGSSDPNAPKDNYSSQFRQNTRYPNANYGTYGAGNIASLLNTLCSKAVAGGGTLESNGYCD